MEEYSFFINKSESILDELTFDELLSLKKSNKLKPTEQVIVDEHILIKIVPTIALLSITKTIYDIVNKTN